MHGWMDGWKYVYSTADRRVISYTVHLRKTSEPGFFFDIPNANLKPFLEKTIFLTNICSY